MNNFSWVNNITIYLFGGADVKATGSAHVSTFWLSKLYAVITRTMLKYFELT